MDQRHTSVATMHGLPLTDGMVMSTADEPVDLSPPASPRAATDPDAAPVDPTVPPAVTLDWDTLTRTLRPENNPGFLLWQVANQWQRAQRAALDSIGITHVQFILLAGLGFLERREGVVSQSRLAAFCRTDVMMTSQVVRSLEQTGLVRREKHPDDNRAKRVTLTPVGVERLNAAMPAVLDADAQFFGPLGARGQDMVDALRQLLRRQGLAPALVTPEHRDRKAG